MENKITKKEIMDFYNIFEFEVDELLKTYTLEQIKARWVKVNWKIQVVPLPDNKVMEEQDYKTLMLKDFLIKYPFYTKYKARKKFWNKEIRKVKWINLSKDKYDETFEEYTNDKENKIIEKFWIDRIEIRKLLNNYTYTEILNWKLVNWKLVVRDMFRVVRN